MVSIITVVYNSEHLIEKTICSIINQTCDDYEYIVIDGGSKDGTLDIIRKYGSFISQWISEPDQGIYDAMNKALSMASGRYVWFINSGDRIYDSYVVEKLRSCYDKSKPDIMYGETMLVEENGEIIGLRSSRTTRKLPRKLSDKSMINGMVVSHQSFIPRLALADKFDLTYKCSSDLDWAIRCLRKAKTVVNMEMILSWYLVGGYSYKNQKMSWKERWEIYTRYYGCIPTLFAHIRIIGRGIQHRIIEGKNY